MTEQDSDPFYQDLRRKLENYGSPPPESAWAGIQQQLPPPRPPRWRRLAPVLLLALLLVSITVTTPYWRPLFGGSSAEQVAPTDGSVATQRNSESGSMTGSSASEQLANTSPATAAAANSTGVNPPAATSAGDDPLAAGAGPNERTTIRLGRLAPLAAKRPSGRFGVLPNRRRTRLRTGSDASDVARYAATEGTTSRRNRTAAESRTAVARRLGLVAAADRGGTQAHSRTTDRPGLRSRVEGRPLSRRDRATDQAAQPESAASFTNEPLALRPLLTPPALTEEPEVNRQRLPRAKRPTQQELRLHNWSVQLTGGPGLTYRLLGGSPTQLEGLERPAIGGSGQLMGAYAWSRQLTVAGGLGFAQYANAMRYTLKKTATDQTRQIDFRDVYNFVTIPVQAQFTLQGNHRWRYGVLGGGTLALLTGARTTEGSVCNCGQRRWIPGTADSTFQRLNLALTVGAFANYQVAPGQWLTIRPQGQLFLNSLTLGNRTARRPWSVGVQVGYSWDLDPRQH
ncbi:hypothetical protein KLP40_06235 [Hymenobacter sp. NST-14]|uniref:hypothetical protein n=1 Tax=Hymenobacter piscis TaxID=2839984 RepID=UPI001C037D19|nr:hypothetical protein [Hymenobacter piscis]MBT9392756.1 hypothetical protein [Hymenobacter piscis]